MLPVAGGELIIGRQGGVGQPVSRRVSRERRMLHTPPSTQTPPTICSEVIGSSSIHHPKNSATTGTRLMTPAVWDAPRVRRPTFHNTYPQPVPSSPA